jgi:hypothetical protein
MTTCDTFSRIAAWIVVGAVVGGALAPINR